MFNSLGRKLDGSRPKKEVQWNLIQNILDGLVCVLMQDLDISAGGIDTTTAYADGKYTCVATGFCPDGTIFKKVRFTVEAE